MGPSPTVAGGPTSADYAIMYHGGTLTITTAPLTVTAADKSRAYGASDPTFGGTIVGIRNGDSITATYGTTATVGSPVGTYPITATLVDPGSKLGNYSVTNTSGTRTITKAELTVTADR